MIFVNLKDYLTIMNSIIFLKWFSIFLIGLITCLIAYLIYIIIDVNNMGTPEVGGYIIAPAIVAIILLFFMLISPITTFIANRNWKNSNATLLIVINLIEFVAILGLVAWQVF